MDYSGRKGLLLQSSNCLTPNFPVKTSVHYYPNLRNCSSQPLIIKRCFSAKLASSPNSITATPSSWEVLSLTSVRNQRTDGTNRFSPAAPHRSERDQDGLKWRETTQGPGLAAGDRAGWRPSHRLCLHLKKPGFPRPQGICLPGLPTQKQPLAIRTTPSMCLVRKEHFKSFLLC